MDSPKPAPISLTQKFVSGELHFGLWGVVARGIGIVNSLFIIKALTVYLYGVFQLFLSAYAIVTEFISWSGLAVGTEILRLVGRGDEAKAKRLFYEYNTLRLITAGIVWVIVFLGAPFALRSHPDFIGFTRIMSFMLFADLISAMMGTIVQMRLDFKALASRRTIGKSFQVIILTGFFLFSKIGLKEVILSLAIRNFLTMAIFIPAAIRAWKPWRGLAAERGSSILWRVARAHGKWDSVKNFLSQFINQIEPWLINIFISTAAVGIYGIASQLAEVVMQVVPRNTMNSLIARVFHDRERSKKVFTYAIKYLTLWGMMGMIGSVLTIPILIHVFLPQYIPALPFFYLLLFAIPVKSFQWMTDLFLIIFRQQKFVFIRMLTRNALLLGLLLVLLPTIGLWALPLAELFVRISVTFVGYRRLLKIRPELQITPRLIFSFGPEDRKILGNLFTHFKLFFRRFAI